MTPQQTAANPDQSMENTTLVPMIDVKLSTAINVDAPKPKPKPPYKYRLSESLVEAADEVVIKTPTIVAPKPIDKYILEDFKVWRRKTLSSYLRLSTIPGNVPCVKYEFTQNEMRKALKVLLASLFVLVCLCYMTFAIMVLDHYGKLRHLQYEQSDNPIQFNQTAWTEQIRTEIQREIVGFNLDNNQKNETTEHLKRIELLETLYRAEKKNEQLEEKLADVENQLAKLNEKYSQI